MIHKFLGHLFVHVHITLYAKTFRAGEKTALLALGNSFVLAEIEVFVAFAAIILTLTMNILPGIDHRVVLRAAELFGVH